MILGIRSRLIDGNANPTKRERRLRQLESAITPLQLATHDREQAELLAKEQAFLESLTVEELYQLHDEVMAELENSDEVKRLSQLPESTLLQAYREALKKPCEH